MVGHPGPGILLNHTRSANHDQPRAASECAQWQSPSHLLAHPPTVLMLSLKVWPSPLTRRLMPSKPDRSYSAAGAGAVGMAGVLSPPVKA